MQKLWILCGLCLLTSCKRLTFQKDKTRELIEQEMQNIDWNDVDQYPLFENCDETASKMEQKQCFENTLLSHFSSTMQEFEFKLDAEINDTVNVDFLIDKTGSISVLEIKKNPALEAQIPEFNGIIAQCLNSLPPVAPAIKRGIPVNARFRIPIVLNSD
ncbi:hypothetical protein K8352_17910 [Flavobacteriaceae bacterium F89]|uniref:Uncharacterized protein n=1 Tax=Cerina litoralis TaxID=2874477 RepID=A0AAE3EWZ5_9FLAO|nr:hypothetical protein [Cerina litoralis]MCG2462642.1 hypothetical protein [Cerina litoralis]